MDPKLINVPSGFGLESRKYFKYEMHFRELSRVRTAFCVVVSNRNYLNLFLPIIE